MTPPPTPSHRLNPSTSWSQSTIPRFFSQHATFWNLSSTTSDTSSTTLSYPNRSSNQPIELNTGTIHKKTLPPHSLPNQPSVVKYLTIKTPKPHHPNTPLAPSKSSTTNAYDHISGEKLEPLFNSIEFQSPISRKNLDTPQAPVKSSIETHCPPVPCTNLFVHLTTESSHAPPSFSSPSTTTYTQRKIPTYFSIINCSTSSPLPNPLPSQDPINSRSTVAKSRPPRPSHCTKKYL
jgi:hypothetical protein